MVRSALSSHLPYVYIGAYSCHVLPSSGSSTSPRFACSNVTSHLYDHLIGMDSSEANVNGHAEIAAVSCSAVSPTPEYDTTGVRA